MGDTVPTTEACALAGVTFRQVDYWARAGYLDGIGATTPGSGVRREWSGQAVAVLAVVGLVSGAIRVGHLGPLCELLAGWPASTWGDEVILVEPAGTVWRDTDGRPPVAVSIDLGAILAGVRDRFDEMRRRAA